jgi:hypothetical protein
MSSNVLRVVRWITRFLAALMAAFIAFMLVGNAVTDGVGPFFKMTFRESLMMASFLVVFLGLILGWKREKLGGWLVVGGMVLFYLFDFAFSGTFPRGWFFPLIALPGLLFLWIGYTQKATD